MHRYRPFVNPLTPTRCLLVLLVWLLAHAAVQAQEGVRIVDVRVGFPSAHEDCVKIGAWAPVAVDVDVAGGDFQGELSVESPDSDGQWARYTRDPLTIASRQGVQTLLSYTKIAGGSVELRVQLQGKQGERRVQSSYHYPASKPTRSAVAMVPPGRTLVLALGRPQGLEQPDRSESSGRIDLQSGWRVAVESNLARLPEQWFGYEGVDVVVLPTGGAWEENLARRLAQEPSRRQALVRWVEMGGHLVVSAGVNQNQVGDAASFPLADLLPAVMQPALRVERMEGVKALVVEKGRIGSVEVRAFGVDLVPLVPRGTGQSIAFEEAARHAAIVQGTYGLGRVTLIGFDTDAGPFASWQHRREFWTALLDLRSAVVRPIQELGRFGMQGERDLASQLADHLERFEDVPMVSFTLVISLLFLYIVLVGPIDYLVLKRIVKRLELTWLTFPLVVILVCLGANDLARRLKGDELRIHKLDLMDLDLRTGRGYGSSWFTVFSPRMEHYGLGIRPAQPGAAAEGTVLSWLGRPGQGARSLGRATISGMFSQTYDILDHGAELRDVPIQVWAMKTLTGRWISRPAAVSFENRLEADRLQVKGSFTSRLPWRLNQAVLVFRKRVWNLGAIEPGQEVRLPDLSVALPGSWSEAASAARGPQPLPPVATGRFQEVLWRLTFGRILPPRPNEQHEYLDYLDQGWRMDFPEAILLAQISDESGPAAAVNQAAHPGCRFEPFSPTLSGWMGQNTILRVYFPVAAGR